MLSNRATYYALLSLSLCCLGSALRQGGQARGDTAPSMRDVQEIAKAAEAAGRFELTFLNSCDTFVRQGTFT